MCSTAMPTEVGLWGQFLKGDYLEYHVYVLGNTGPNGLTFKEIIPQPWVDFFMLEPFPWPSLGIPCQRRPGRE